MTCDGDQIEAAINNCELRSHGLRTLSFASLLTFVRSVLTFSLSIMLVDKWYQALGPCRTRRTQGVAIQDYLLF